MALLCMVTNCGEGMDNVAVGTILSGLSQCGEQIFAILKFMVCRFRVVSKKSYHCEVQGVLFSNEFKLTQLAFSAVCVFSKFNSNFYTFNLSVTFFVCFVYHVSLVVRSHTCDDENRIFLPPPATTPFSLLLTHSQCDAIHSFQVPGDVSTNSIELIYLY